MKKLWFLILLIGGGFVFSPSVFAAQELTLAEKVSGCKWILAINDAADCSEDQACIDAHPNRIKSCPAEASGTTSSSGSTAAGSVNNGTPSTSGTLNPANHKPLLDGPGLRGGADLVEARLDGGVSKERDIQKLIVGWVNLILQLVLLIAVLAIIWAGVLYITSLGDDGKIDTAKKIIIWVVVGILVIFASYAIVRAVLYFTFV